MSDVYRFEPSNVLSSLQLSPVTALKYSATDGVSASLLHPPLPALPLKLVFVIERIYDQPPL